MYLKLVKLSSVCSIVSDNRGLVSYKAMEIEYICIDFFLRLYFAFLFQ